MSEGRFQITLDMLLPSLREIAESCGMDVATVLVEKFGGRRIRVPLKLKDGHPLASLGELPARKLVENFGYTYLDVPTSLLTRDARARLIHELYGDGKPHGEIARLMGCTEHTVSRVLRSGPPEARPRRPGRRSADPRQMDLEAWLKG